jgi:hypothetical protein
MRPKAERPLSDRLEQSTSPEDKTKKMEDDDRQRYGRRILNDNRSSIVKEKSFIITKSLLHLK